MSQANDALEVELRKHLFLTASFTKPTTIDIGLYTAAPGEAGGGTEVTGGSYARVARNPLDANWTSVSATTGLTDNAAVITFPTPTANWGLITHFQLIFNTGAIYGTLTASKTVNNGDAAPSFAAAALSVTVA